MLQPQHTQLADVDLPELEDEVGQGLASSANSVRRPGTGADVAAAESALAAEQTSRAAEDIERAAKTVSMLPALISLLGTLVTCLAANIPAAPRRTSSVRPRR